MRPSLAASLRHRSRTQSTQWTRPWSETQAAPSGQLFASPHEQSNPVQRSAATQWAPPDGLQRANTTVPLGSTESWIPHDTHCPTPSAEHVSTAGGGRHEQLGGGSASGDAVWSSAQPGKGNAKIRASRLRIEVSSRRARVHMHCLPRTPVPCHRYSPSERSEWRRCMDPHRSGKSRTRRDSSRPSRL